MKKISKYDLCSSCRKIRGPGTSSGRPGLTIEEYIDGITAGKHFDPNLNKTVAGLLYMLGGCNKCSDYCTSLVVD